MNEACQVQRNVSMTIKDGIKKIKRLVEHLRKKHVQIKEAKKTYKRGLTFTEEARVTRKKIRSRIEGELTTRAILAASKHKKRSRSSSASSSIDDDGKKTK